MKSFPEDPVDLLEDKLDGEAMSRRSFCRSFPFVAAALLGTSSSSQAYDKTFPGELQASDGILDERQRKRQLVQQQQQQETDSILIPKQLSRPIGALLWGTTLWLLSGSRSNPVITPLANVLYDKEQEKWLKDRNDGLFADLPVPLLAMLTIVFFALGVGADNALTFLAQNNHSASLQLAGVTLIGAGTLELGRIASGEKKQTREESDRETQLKEEFAEFATRRLVEGGSCHRNEVVGAFRRFYAKYRRAESIEYPLADLEIEQLLRAWCRARGVEMTNAGFYYGIKINKEADVFA